ncbi:hypothetical protein GCM10011380_19570 [Sphingomonas metalli]|uniref:MAPEG family protein n=2 Tax=Sphingomonas metalli TaxID=1779358 RepID=A0A916T3U3_9SPHN|nr:hypothetical protein GCM10011380_19570 [Sphingomonas metalli]
MAAALCVTLLVSALCLYRGAATTLSPSERLIITAKADVIVMVWLAATIANVARLRFFSPDDIAGSGAGVATPQVERARAILQNTLEQVVFALPVHMSLALLVASSVPLTLALAALFATGRLLFWIGYARDAQARAFGFALTFYPTVAGLLVLVVESVKQSL